MQVDAKQPPKNVKILAILRLRIFNEDQNMAKNLKNERFEVLLKDFYKYSIDCFIQQWSVSKHEAYAKK